jgi:type III restriction enzyme
LIREYAAKLKASGKYEELSKDVTEFKLTSQVFDVYGISIQNQTSDAFNTAQSDIDRIFLLADKKLGETGIGNFYITSSSKTDADWENPEYKVDVILFAADSECLRKLDEYAAKRFNEIDDAYRRKVNSLKGADEKFKKDYNDIVSNSAEVTKHVFGLPETIMGTDKNGDKFEKHLFVDEHGFAKFKLNSWEKKTLEQEFACEDFITWYRNPPRKSFSLAIPYEKDSQVKPMFPDFIIVRKDGDGYVADLLEPHNPELGDNLGKAKAFAKYAEECALFGRIQLIRVNGEHVKRLEFTKRDIRERVMLCNNLEDLNRVFSDCAVEE